MNPIELVTSILKAKSDVPTTPLNVLEIGNLWMMITATENFSNMEKVIGNVISDPDLKKKMDDLISNYHEIIINDIAQILLKGGVDLPQPPSEKPKIETILPTGAKMTDEEIANLMVFNLVWGIKQCTRGLTEAVRADVGELFAKHAIRKIAFSTTVKTMMADKGWLKVPPVMQPIINKQS